jgi:citrate synthase
VLQSVISLLASFDTDFSEGSKEVTQRRAIRIIAKIPTIIAAWERIRKGVNPTRPSTTMGHAENFLYMLKGETIHEEVIRCFDVALILHAEHSFNASTFTSRVISSTGADIYASISGAVGSLAGKLHGGANSRVMQGLYDIGSPDNVENWISEQFDRKNRIMGMGHAVYRTMDPRARILQKMAEGMIKLPGADPKWLEMTKMIAKIAQDEFQKRKNRNIYPNVDLFSSSVYTTMGIPMDLFTPLFAMSRVSGWSAHAIEEQFPETSEIKPVLYRPSADYTGNYCGPTGCVYVPVDKR